MFDEFIEGLEFFCFYLEDLGRGWSYLSGRYNEIINGVVGDSFEKVSVC